MSERLWGVMLIVAMASACVWAVAAVSPLTDLRLLPVSKRHRVEWCARHVRQVLLTGGVLVLVMLLAGLQLVAATSGNPA